MKKCPYCAEEIQDEAVVCKHCQRDVPEKGKPFPAAPTEAPVQRRGGDTKTGVILLVFALFLMLGGDALAGFGWLLAWIGFAFVLPGGGVARWGGGFVAALVMLAMMTAATGSGVSTSPSVGVAELRQDREGGERLELLSARSDVSRGGGYLTVEGEVKNISSEPIRNVAVLVSWYTQDGTHITSDDTLIEYNPILPGQTSPYKSMVSANPAAKTFKVSFKHLIGGSITTLDSRPRR